jgi:drug/metabolite transporter (DMT)-like permease
VLGVCAVGTGVFLVRGLTRHADTRGLLFGLAIACCIAGYTLVDKEGIAHASPIAYLELVLLPAALVTLGYELGTRGSVVLRANLDWGTIGAALASFGAYALVLAALDRAAAAPVAAVRESGVLIAVGLGAVVLHEKVGWPRAAGAALVVAGVALVALT